MPLNQRKHHIDKLGYDKLMSLEMLTFNIQYGASAGIEDWITGKAPDIFCLQEFPESDVSKFATDYQKIFAVSFTNDTSVYGELIGYKPDI